MLRYLIHFSIVSRSRRLSGDRAGPRSARAQIRPLINKPAPTFRLPQLKAAGEDFLREDMRGKVWLLNVWASWCVACRDEHPYCSSMRKSGVVPIYGLNYKDRTRRCARMARRPGRSVHGLSAVDFDGRVGIDYGVYGAPETYVIDQAA
jgi:cytochrome c biogenesis protein CcmG/thiol:disulfide interchange protein DsbE